MLNVRRRLRLGPHRQQLIRLRLGPCWRLPWPADRARARAPSPGRVRKRGEAERVVAEQVPWPCEQVPQVPRRRRRRSSHPSSLRGSRGSGSLRSQSFGLARPGPRLCRRRSPPPNRHRLEAPRQRDPLLVQHIHRQGRRRRLAQPCLPELPWPATRQALLAGAEAPVCADALTARLTGMGHGLVGLADHRLANL